MCCLELLSAERGGCADLSCCQPRAGCVLLVRFVLLFSYAAESRRWRGEKEITVVWDAEEGLFSLDQSVEQPYALSNP